MGNICRTHGEFYRSLNDDFLIQCRKITGYNDEYIRNAHKNFFAVAHDGRLRKSHMEELLGDYLSMASQKSSKYLTDCIFAAIDTNNDGYIDFFEYIISIKFFQTESPIEKADFVFRIIDKNNDNVLTKKEIQRILKCLQDCHKSLNNIQVNKIMHDGPKPAADAIIKELDDDESGTISISEFVDGWLKNETIRVLFTF